MSALVVGVIRFSYSASEGFNSPFAQSTVIGLAFTAKTAFATATMVRVGIKTSSPEPIPPSLYANKIITAGDGGFVLSTRTDPDLFDRANSYTNHGFTKEFHFLHFESSGNYKMSGLQAALVTPAVALIPQVMKDRSRIAQLYRKELNGVAGLELMPTNPHGMDAPWVFGILAESKKMRTTIRQKLADEGIETRDFFLPLHLQPFVVQSNPSQIESHPNAEDLAVRGFYLPTFYNLSEEEIKRIFQCIKNTLKN